MIILILLYVNSTNTLGYLTIRCIYLCLERKWSKSVMREFTVYNCRKCSKETSERSICFTLLSNDTYHRNVRVYSVRQCRCTYFSLWRMIRYLTISLFSYLSFGSYLRFVLKNMDEFSGGDDERGGDVKRNSGDTYNNVPICFYFTDTICEMTCALVNLFLLEGSITRRVHVIAQWYTGKFLVYGFPLVI